MTVPSISVLIPVYNAQDFLGEAIESILQQTMRDFEVICVDDGSTDDSAAILASIAERDARVKILHQENQGIVAALNNGLAECKADLVARMDADDIAMPQRFAKQLRYLQDNPQVLALGSSVVEIDEDGDGLGIQEFGLNHDEINRRMVQANTGMAHPTVMMRREAVAAIGGYRTEYEWVEDHDLWLRLAEQGELANLQDVLLSYRQHAGSVCRSKLQERHRRLRNLMAETCARRGIEMPDLRARLRSPAGPGKWARIASRNGQWQVASKHLRRQWKKAPLSPFTWRMTLEATTRAAVLSLVGGKQTLPAIPHYDLEGTKAA